MHDFIDVLHHPLDSDFVKMFSTRKCLMDYWDASFCIYKFVCVFFFFGGLFVNSVQWVSMGVKLADRVERRRLIEDGGEG